MVPGPRQEAEKAEKEAPLSLVDREPASGHPEPPDGTPRDPVAPTCLQDTKPSSTPVVSSVHQQLAPESLDPRTLRLLWGQRELEIQALRWTIHNRQDARHCHILYEVAGLPAERSSRNQEKSLQNQVQKLTLELKEQKEQAQLEKSQLEERLQQALNTMQRLEAELEAFQRSCLLQLARSSWVGRVLRSSTGSVEVVTAETLMDASDLSENDQVPSTKEGFRLEDVDWNSIAQRYPNLLSNIESNSDQKHPRPLPSPEAPLWDQWGPELHGEHTEQRLKSVEWSSLPFGGTSSSGGTGSDSSSGRLAVPYRMHKVMGHPPCTPGHSSEPTEPHWRRFSRETQAQPEGLSLGPWNRPSKTVQTKESCVDSEHGPPRHRLHGSSCLKIVAVSRKERFVRVLNQSLEETADLSGLMLQQLLHGFPVCMYRFPPGTLLAPRHHVTVWGEGPGSTKKQSPSSMGREPVYFHSSQGCVTLLLNPKGEVLSEHPARHCVTPVSRIFTDNTDLSIDRFPLSEAGLGADPWEQRRRPQHTRAGRVQSPRGLLSTLVPVQDPHLPPQVPPRPGLPPKNSRALHAACPAAPPPPPRLPRTQGLLRPRSTSKLPRPREVPAPPQAAETRAPGRLPALPDAGLCQEDCGARKEHRVQVCRKSVDGGCPMVALSVQSTAESRYGFRFLPCPPVTAEPNARV